VGKRRWWISLRVKPCAQSTNATFSDAQNRISVVVSHRLALAKLVDRIVVLEHGKIIEVGSHEALMQRGDRYYTMFSRQASSYL
jgi:ABC-type multidrug transport system fused ATPase/permease subunit